MNDTLRILLAATVVSATLTVVGCSAVDDALHHEATSHFDSRTELDGEWGKSADWLPADATDIEVRESTKDDPAVLIAVTDAALDPGACVHTQRRSVWVYAVDWAPEGLPEEVWACGAWDVWPTDEGYFAWTPNDPDERAH
jgi:hypothetical protein